MSQTISQEVQDVLTRVNAVAADVQTLLAKIPGPGDQLTAGTQANLDAADQALTTLQTQLDAVVNPPPPNPPSG